MSGVGPDPYPQHICPQCGQRVWLTIKGFVNKGGGLCIQGRPHQEGDG